MLNITIRAMIPIHMYIANLAYCPLHIVITLPTDCNVYSALGGRHNCTCRSFLFRWLRLPKVADYDAYFTKKEGAMAAGGQGHYRSFLFENPCLPIPIAVFIPFPRKGAMRPFLLQTIPVVAPSL